MHSIARLRLARFRQLASARARLSLRTCGLEQLEQRSLLAVTTPWETTALFNQFGGGDPTVFGFGIDDGEPDANGDGKSDISGVEKAPRFVGFSFADTWSDGVDLGVVSGSVDIDFALKLGIEYGFYVNAGTGSVFQDGTFSIDVDESAPIGPVPVTTGLNIASGGLFTASPRLSTFADLVFEFTGSIGAEGCAVLAGCTDGSIPFSIQEKIPLASINRQVADANGNFVFNGDGTPRFDGTIAFIGSDIWSTGEAAYEEIQGVRDEVTDAKKDKHEAERKLRNSSNQAERDTARMKLTQAETTISNADTTESSLHNGKTNQEFGGGQIVQVSFEEAPGDLLGLKMNLGVGVGFKNILDLSKPLGDVTLTLPEISLADQTVDADGGLSASTDDFGLAQDSKRKVLEANINLGGILGGGYGLGTTAISVGPLSAELTTLEYVINAILNVNQDFDVDPQYKTRFDFSQPIDVMVDGTTLSGRSSIEFDPGAEVQLLPGSQVVTVMPSLVPTWSVNNDIGLDLDINGILQALRLKATFGSFDLFDTGFLFERSDPLLDTDLGSLYDDTFTVSAQPIPLQGFTVGGIRTDLSVAAIANHEQEFLLEQGTTESLTLVVSNAGPDAATGVTVTHVLPPHMMFVSGSGCSAAAGTVTCSVGNLGAGQQSSLNLQFAGDDGADEKHDVQFTVAGNERETEPENNTAHVLANVYSPRKIFVDTTGTDTFGELTPLHVAVADAEQSPDRNVIVFASSANVGLPTVFRFTGETGQTEIPLPGFVRLSQPDVVVVDSVILRKDEFTKDEDGITLNRPLVGGEHIRVYFSGDIAGEQGLTTDGGPLKITKSVSIFGFGPASTLLKAKKGQRVFEFGGMGANTYELSGLLFTPGDGFFDSDANCAPGDFCGGILLNDPDLNDTLIIRDSVFLNNHSDLGGAIRVIGGNLMLDNVVFAHNSADYGGAVSLEASSATFNNVKAYGNTAAVGGGAVDVLSYLSETQPIIVQDSVFLSNSSPSGADINLFAQNGGSIDWMPQASIFAGSTGPNISRSQPGGGTVSTTSLDRNLSDGFDASLDAPGDRTSLPPITLSSHQVPGGVPGAVIGNVFVQPTSWGTDLKFRVTDPRFEIISGKLKLKAGQSIDDASEPTVPLRILATDQNGLAVSNEHLLWRDLVLTVVGAPAVPGSFLATVSSPTSALLLWNDVANETEYRVFRGSNGSPPVQIATLPAGSVEFAVSGLTPQSQQSFFVQAVNLAGISATATQTLTLPLAPPSSPKDFTVLAASAGTAELFWKTAGGQTGYRVLQDGAEIASLPANATKLTVNNLTPLTEYTFRVEATNSAGATSSSDNSVTLPAPVLTIEDTLARKADGTVTFSVTLSHAPSAGLPVSVNFLTMDLPGGATAGTDYETSSGTVSFAAGDPLTKTFTVPILAGTPDDAARAFEIDLSAVSNARLFDAEVLGTILGDSLTGLMVSLTNGNLMAQDIVAGGAGNQVTVTYDAGANEIVITDTAGSVFAATAQITQVNPGQVRIPLGSIGPVLTINAGDGDDSVTFSNFNQLGVLDVVVNGGRGNDVFEAGPYRSSFTFNGAQGTDTWRFTGGVTRERITLTPTRATVENESNGRVMRTNGVENYVIGDSDGYDLIRINGDAGPNTLTANTTHVEMTGSGYSYTVDGASKLIARGEGGNDTATVQGEADARDNYISRPTDIRAFNRNYDTQAFDFVSTQFAGNGGDDKGRLFGSAASDDLFEISPGVTRISGNGYDNSINNFARLFAFADSVNDRAILTGSDQRDEFIHTPTAGGRYAHYARIRTLDAGYSYTLLDFPRVDVMEAVGRDQAYLTGFDNQAETLTADTRLAVFQGQDFLVNVMEWPEVRVFGGDGAANDTALLQGTAQVTDTVKVRQQFPQLSNAAGFVNAFGFEEVTARTTEAGRDRIDRQSEATDYLLTLDGNWLE